MHNTLNHYGVCLKDIPDLAKISMLGCRWHCLRALNRTRVVTWQCNKLSEAIYLFIQDQIISPFSRLQEGPKLQWKDAFPYSECELTKHLLFL